MLCFVGGNVMFDDDGAYYDHDPEAIIKLYASENFARLLDLISSELEIDQNYFGVEIAHHNPLSVYGRIQYVLVPIKTDADVAGLIEHALSNNDNRRQQLLITKVAASGYVAINPYVDQVMEPVIEAVSDEHDEPMRYNHFHGNDWIERMMESTEGDSEEEYKEDEDADVIIQ